MVFVPMIGDSFLIAVRIHGANEGKSCFRPHDWGFFFNSQLEGDGFALSWEKFSSP